MFYTYVLKNKSTDETYIGYSNDVYRRLKEHNQHHDYELVYYEAYQTEKLARQREMKLKQDGNALQGLKRRLK